MSTKHMNAARGDFAETVLMPGDPLRARYIAETYLDDARQVTDVRNMLGFTGQFQGIPVSVMVGSVLPTLTMNNSALRAARKATWVLLESSEPMTAQTFSP